VPSVVVHFHGELLDLLAVDRRSRPARVEVGPGTTVKDLAESLGVPHTEIDAVLVNGVSVGFGHRLRDGDDVDVYPDADRVEGSPVVRLRSPGSPVPRFVLDVHLGRLARLLRLLGFDSVWRNDMSDDELVGTSVGEGRVLLTRDRSILKRSAVTQGYYVRSTDRRSQVVEVLGRYGLFGSIAPFGRCLRCNGVLQDVAKVTVENRLPPLTRRTHDEFRTCAACGRIYWRGSHYDRLAAVVQAVRQAAPDAGSAMPQTPEGPERGAAPSPEDR